MDNERPTSPQADPADHEPSEARPAGCACCGRAPAGDRTERLRALLEGFAELALRTARVVVAEVEAAAAERRAGLQAAGARPVWQGADLALHRLARTARLCMMLSERLADGRLERAEGRKRERAAAPLPKPRAAGEVAGRVKAVIEREAEPAERERLERALSERLDDEDIERDLDRYTVDELVRRICRDLGIDADAAVAAVEAEEDVAPVAAVAGAVRRVWHPARRSGRPASPDGVVVKFGGPAIGDGPGTPPGARRTEPPSG